MSRLLIALFIILAAIIVPPPPPLAHASQPLIVDTGKYSFTLTSQPQEQKSRSIPVGPNWVVYTFTSTGQVYYYNSDGSNMSIMVPAGKWGSLVSLLALPSPVLSHNSTVVRFFYNYTLLALNIQLTVYFIRIQGSFNLEVVLAGSFSLTRVKVPGQLALSFANPGNRLESSTQTRLRIGTVGFDWSDTTGYHYNNVTRSLSWDLPGTFNLDPLTLGTSTVDAIRWPFQRKVFTTGLGAIFVFYCDGSNLQYATSLDGGSTWSTSQAFTGCTTGSETDVWYDGSLVYLVTLAARCTGGGLGQLCYRTGTISGSTITLNTAQLIRATESSSSILAPSIITDSNGNIWMSGWHDGTTTMDVMKCSCTGQSSWTNATGFPTTVTGGSNGHLVPLTAGKIALVYADGAAPVNVRAWDGSAFKAAVSTADSMFATVAFSAVGVGDNVQLVFGAGSGTFSDLYHFQTNAWDAALQIDTSSVYPVLTYDVFLTTFYVFFYKLNTIYYSTYTGTGAWTSGISWVNGETLTNGWTINTAYNTAPQPSGVDIAPVIWLTGSVSPFSIRYFSLTTPTRPAGPPPLPPPPLIGLAAISAVGGAALNVTSTGLLLALKPPVILASLATSFILTLGAVTGPRRRKMD